MNTKSIIEEIKSQMTGDPLRDGPFLKDISEKYQGEENSAEIDRELAKLIYECSYDDMNKTMQNYLEAVNPQVNDKLARVMKRYENLNFNGGMEVLREIIKDNLFAWEENETTIYKSFGEPIEYALYMWLYRPEKEVKPISCDLSEVYSLYGMGLTRKKRYSEAIDAYQKALDFNPTNAGIYEDYCELLKEVRQADELKVNTDKLMRCAVTKEQLGTGYFNYSFYFSERNELEKAYAMLEMSRIFTENTELIQSETEYISERLGIAGNPPAHTRDQLMNIMLAEGIQPGPSIAAVDSANVLAERAYADADYQLALYFNKIVLELTEDDGIRKKIRELEKLARKNS